LLVAVAAGRQALEGAVHLAVHFGRLPFLERVQLARLLEQVARLQVRR